MSIAPSFLPSELAFMEGGGEMGALIRTHRWETTALGTPTTWPQALRTAIQLILNTGHPMYIWWGDELICFYNDAYRRSIGLERHPSSLGQPGRDVWAEIWPIIGTEVEQVMAGRGATWHENALVPITRNGRREDVYWTYSYSPIGDSTAPKGVGGVLVVCTETTERFVSEQHHRTQLERLWQSSQDLLLVAKFDSTIVSVNPAWTRVLGWNDDELVGKSFIDFVHPEDLTATRAEAKYVEEEGRTTLRFENRYRAKDGHWVWLSWSATADDGLFHALARDVSAERERQAALAAAQDALRQSQKMEAMGQLTGGVAHDFNNLLTPIIAGLDLLQRRNVGDERERRMIDGAMQSADRAKTLVQRLLAFARRQPLQAQAVDVVELVRGMADLLASTSGPRVRLELDCAADVPCASADPNQIEMAILNLAVNARDAMPNGGTLTISVRSDTATAGHRSGLSAGQYIRLSIADSGTGMDEVTATRAIEPFFSTKGIGKGTGLGLSMVHGLAAQLGGALAISSKLGLGTRVDLWLPASTEKLGVEVTTSLLEVGTVSGTALVVDDEDLVRMSTADMLNDAGYTVVEAASAEEALRIVEGGLNFDLLVTDHVMPGQSGTDLAYELRRSRPGSTSD